MKIGIDISQVIYGTGVSTYTRNLVKNLLKVDKHNKYILFGGSLRRKNELVNFVNGLKGNVESRIFAFPPTFSDIVWNRLHVLKMERLVGQIDVFHSSDWSQPPSDAFKVTTVHDLTPIKYPKETHPKTVSAHKARLGWVKKEVDKVIAPSESTKKDLVDLGIKRDRIVVIPEAVDPIFSPAKKSEIKRLKNRLKIKSSYLLSVGVGPRKNTKRVIRAFELFNRNKDFVLIFVGYDHYGYKKETKKVRFLGHVSVEDLRILYSGAEMLVYPSLYEGFGLPILEAFACNCPVVTSNTSSLQEVAGRAAKIVGPYNISDIAGGIESVLSNRKNLVEKGKRRFKKYSWEKTAKETVKVYEGAK
jgi:glycosyltransferase involved in cell wall biosynthesis